MYTMRKKFTSYKSYADAGMEDIFSAEELKDAQRLKATWLETTIFENRNGKFFPKKLPLEAQFSPVYKIIVADLNNDNVNDLILLGNNDYPRLKIGKIDARRVHAFRIDRRKSLRPASHGHCCDFFICTAGVTRCRSRLDDVNTGSWGGLHPY